MKGWYKALEDLVWLTQLGLNMLLPLVLCLAGCWWAVERWNWPEWLFLPAVLLGLAAGWLLERALPEEAAFSAGGEEGRVLRSALVTALALVGHNLPEGAMTLFASLDDPAVGLRLAVAIGLHNLPEGLAVALPVLYATKSRGRAFLAALASGFAEPAGALLAFGVLGGRITASLVTGMAALVCGVMCWVSVAELLPTGLSLGRKEVTAAGFGAGLLAMTLGIALLS